MSLPELGRDFVLPLFSEKPLQVTVITAIMLTNMEGKEGAFLHFGFFDGAEIFGRRLERKGGQRR
jgi:hypothetical protein